jgi:hypothetical protein
MVGVYMLCNNLEWWEYTYCNPLQFAICQDRSSFILPSPTMNANKIVAL